MLNREVDTEEDTEDDTTSLLSSVWTWRDSGTSLNDEEVDEEVVTLCWLCVASSHDWIDSCSSSLSSIGSNNELGRPFVPWRRWRWRLREYFRFRLNCHWNGLAFKLGQRWSEDESDFFGDLIDSFAWSGPKPLGLCLALSIQCLWSTQLEPPDLENALKDSNRRIR